MMSDEQAAAFAFAVKVRETLFEERSRESLGDDFDVEAWTALYESALKAAKRFNRTSPANAVSPKASSSSR